MTRRTPKPTPPVTPAKRGDLVVFSRTASSTELWGPTKRTVYFVAAIVDAVSREGHVNGARAHDGRAFGHRDITAPRILSADKIPGRKVAALLERMHTVRHGADFATLRDAQDEIRKTLGEIEA